MKNSGLGIVILLIWGNVYSQKIEIDTSLLKSSQPLNGKCAFVWQRLLSPDQFQKNLTTTSIQIPGTWKDIGYPDIGLGTYKMTIQLHRRLINYSILFPIINSSAKVWMNGKLIDELGVCDADKKKYRAKFGSLLIAVPPDTISLELVIQVVNYSYSNGGISRAPQFGPTSLIIHEMNTRKGVENFFVGSLIAMFIYQIILFFLYQKGKPYLYLGLICLIVAVRAMVTHGGSFLLLDLFPVVPMELWKKIEFFLVYSVVAIFPLYTYYLFPNQAYKKPIPVFVVLSVLLCLVVIFAPHMVYYQVLDVCHVLLIGGFVYSVAVIAKAWRAGNKDASIILFGVLASFPFIFLEIIKNNQIFFFTISFSYLVELGVLVFLLFQVYLLANHYAASYKNLEQININLEAKVQERTAELTKANQVREKLLSMVSHDIKSPLNSLRGVLNVYRKGGITETEMKTLTSHIDENLNTTTILVDNILLWTSNQLKGVKVSYSDIDFKQLVDEHFKIFKTIANGKNVALINSVSQIEIRSDKQILSLVLRNLIANAIKFSFENGRIEINAYQEEGSFTLKIKDNGKGMTKEVVQTLFHSQSTVSTDGTHLEKGTGLGLALCYDYLKYINGEIAVQSEPDKGTIFTIRVTLDK